MTECPVTLTPKAIEKLKQFLNESPESKYVTIGVKGGACAGLKYDMDLVKEKKNWHNEFEIEGLKILIDVVSSNYLVGATIDWKETLTSSGFKFTNPNASSLCGCGQSFSANDKNP